MPDIVCKIIHTHTHTQKDTIVDLEEEQFLSNYALEFGCVGPQYFERDTGMLEAFSRALII